MGNGHRIGITKNRCQVYNPRTKKYVKINTITGKIMACKNEPFKNIRRKGYAKTIKMNNVKKKSGKSKSTGRKYKVKQRFKPILSKFILFCANI